MGKFDQHFKMQEADAMEYAVEKGFFDRNAALSCKEIGDGNINYVFRVQEEDGEKSIIIKHADIRIRSSQSLADTDHNRIEAEILKLEGELAPGLVPEVYLYDPVMCCLVMEDLKDYKNMRYEMIAHHVYPTFAEDISTFMARTLMMTTDHIMDPGEKKGQVKNFINPALCKITEDLVYTDPYTDCHGKNRLNPDNREFFETELYRDEALRLEAAKLKDGFKANAQSLIHGDLHTGSIFVKEGDTKVLDPEFAFYGPAGYDVGNVIANLIFAWASAEAAAHPAKEPAMGPTMEPTMELEEVREDFQGWLENTIEAVVDRFAEKSVKILKEQAADVMAQTEGFAEWFVDGVLSDTAGVAGLELNRRIVGSAKVKDIDGIADAAQKAYAERICVLAAKRFIMERNTSYRRGRDYIDTLRAVREGLEEKERARS